MSDLIVDCKNQKIFRLRRAGPQGRAGQVSFGGPIYLFQSKKNSSQKNPVKNKKQYSQISF